MRGGDLETTTTIKFADLPKAQIESALGAATGFLSRWRDGFTAANRTELGQDAVVIALWRWHTLRDKGRFEAFVRTIARRRRFAALTRIARLRVSSLDANASLVDQIAIPEDEQHEFCIAGESVPREELLRALPEALGHLTKLNASLLMSYYEGFTCRELAARHDLSRDNVKVRVHRARRRVGDLLQRGFRCKAATREGASSRLCENG
jgi:RNA polymerase sigma factor (sigma-70 family)